MPDTKTLPGTGTTILVGILDLQVILKQEGANWIAQALEFDYAAGGTSLEDVKKRFEKGLCETVQEHFNLFGNLDNLLATKPDSEYTLDLLKDSSLVEFYNQISTHECVPKLPKGLSFPFGEIKYFGPQMDKTRAHEVGRLDRVVDEFDGTA